MVTRDNQLLDGASGGPALGANGSGSLYGRQAILAVVLVTFFVFVEVVRNDFVDWDDSTVIVQNEEYRGLGWTHLRWMFTTGFAGHYQPLTWLSYAIESQLCGVDPGVFHLTNLLLHVATAVGFFFITRRLLARALARPTVLGTVVGALLATLVFAVHPLRVESVAWATERRDVLSGLWLMLTVLCYLRAVDPDLPTSRRAMFVLALVCYTLSLLSKAAGITLPIILLLLDVFPLRRVSRTVENRKTVGLPRVLLEKTPFFVLAFVFGLLALWAQRQAGALRTPFEHSFGLRIGQAFYGTIFYLWKSICPTGLIPLYEQDPNATAFDPEYVLAACVFVGLTSASWCLRRRWPALLAAWAAYILFLLPVLGFAQSGPQMVADRYSYLACMPFAVLIGGGMARLWYSGSERRKMTRWVACGIAVVVVATFATATKYQTGIWADSNKLWTAVIEEAPRTGTAHANLASLLNRQGDHEKARVHSRTALDVLPGNRTAHIALARASLALGDFVVAERHFEIALEIRPRDPARLIDLAFVKSRLGKPDQAEALYRKVIDLEPDSAIAYYNLGSFLGTRDRRQDAKLFLERAVQLDPKMVEAWFRLSVLRWQMDEPAAAIAAVETGLGHIPDHSLLNARLAWMLATCRIDELRDGSRAVELARRAMASEAQANLSTREALAAALAEAGDFAGAGAILDELLADPSLAVSEETRSRLESQLARYRNGTPTRDSGGTTR